ncbi:MAG: phenylalanine--tRNA ligase subunit beta [Mogibacterium sp.]|nr:phenylalanine--tRNA ligase subunit beta [Mogibacterium sp.]
MKVSLNWVKKYIDLPEDLTLKQLAYDLTMRTVEIEHVEDMAAKFHDIVVGQILEVRSHPNADMLKVCITDIGEDEPKQIVCGGANLYAGEKVVCCKPGAEVYWHGEDKLIPIKQSKVRGVPSYGMICGASEVFLEQIFPPADEREIVDLSAYDCYPGQSVAEVVGMDDHVIEIDNKSLTNRPDLWGHYGIARELSAIYRVPLKPLPEVDVDLQALPAYRVDIEAPDKCPRYAAIKIENVYDKPSPIWMKTALLHGGMRPINAIVDITNYVMLDVGQPEHGFDSTHVGGEHIIVRNAKKDEKLVLLDKALLDLTEDDLVICDQAEPMALAGIRGGIKDSILPETTSVVIEIANFSAGTIRKTGKRFDEKTDAGIRYEKGLDTQRVDQGIALTLQLFREIFPDCRVTAFGDSYAAETPKQIIEVTQEFLDSRLGKVIPQEEVEDILVHLGCEVTFADGIYRVACPTWRSTGDLIYMDDIEEEIARILCYESFEVKPLPVRFHHAIHQPKFTLDRKIREYLAFRCGFYEIFTYPWIDEKYIRAARIDTADAVRLATPPAPEQANLRSSLIPGMLESTAKNLRYFDEFNLFEVSQVFEKGEYHPSCEEETLPIQKKYLTGVAVGKDAKALFFRVKGVIEGIPGYCHMEDVSFKQKSKPSWADEKVWINVMHQGKCVGSIGLMSAAAMNDAGIKRTQMAFFEINMDMLVPLPSRTNEFKHLPQYPLVEQDLSILVDEGVKWHDVVEAIRFMVKDYRFIEEYRGKQIPDGKKSVMFRIWIGNDDSTMTSKQIDKKMNGIVKALQKKCGAVLREE